jgi:hypothetical protein
MISIPAYASLEIYARRQSTKLIPSRWDGPHFLQHFLAVNCPATIFQSIRDDRQRWSHLIV